MNAEDLAKLIDEATVEIDGKKKLTCGKAFQIAQKHSVSLKEIGDSCNDNKVKIAKCQLGCFE
jgi:hypothetical protein